MLDSWRQALLQHLIFFWLTNDVFCDPDNSNLDLSVHNTLFQSSSVQCVCSFANLNILFLMASLRYGTFLQLCLEGQHPGLGLFNVDVETGVLRVLFNEAAS
jgi:hypothetical protein